MSERYPRPRNVGASHVDLRYRILAALHEKDVGPKTADEIPTDDEQTWALIRRGDTENVIELASDTARGLLITHQPKTIHDLAAVIVFNHPNKEELLREYFAARDNSQRSQTGDTSFEETHGVPLYREDSARVGEPSERSKLRFRRIDAMERAWFTWTMAYLRTHFRDVFDGMVHESRDLHWQGMRQFADSLPENGF